MNAAISATALDGAVRGPVGDELSLLRLDLMRVGYAFLGIGLAVVKWPLLVSHPDPWPPATREVTVNCLLVVVVLAVVPWPYVWRQYVAAEGARWRP